MGRRTALRSDEAKTEGSRRLRVLLRRLTYGAIARKLRVDERAVRLWARDERTPSTIMRERWREAYQWDESIWDAEPVKDSYAGSDPLTTRRPD